MDDMGTPGPNHPAHRGLKDKRSENQFDNVLDLDASRKLKNETGKAAPVKLDISNDEDMHWATTVREPK